MFALRINDIWIDLSPGASLSLKLSNPVFDRDRIERIWSFPFTVQLTEANTAAFRHMHRLDASDAGRKYPADLYIGGLPFELSGQVRITNRANDKIEISFQNAQIAWIERFKSLRLRELSIPVTVTDGTYQPVIDLLFGDPVEELPIEYLIMLNGTLYSSSLASGLADAINADFPDLVTYEPSTGMSFWLHLDTSAAPTVRINLSPTSPGAPGTEYIFATHDPQQTAAEAAVAAAWAAHLADILATPDTHVFPVVAAPNFYDSNNPAYAGYFNYTDTDTLYPGNDFGEPLLPGEGPLDAGWPDTRVPMPFLSAVLAAMFAQAGATSLAGDFATDEDLQQLIVFNNRALDKVYHPRDFSDPASAVSFGYVYAPFNGFASAYDLAAHLPDIKAQEYLLALDSMFGLTFRVQGGVASIFTIQSQLGQQPADWTPRFEPDYSGEMKQHTGYVLDFNRDGDDRTLPGQLARVAVGTEEDRLELTSQIFSLYHITTGIPNRGRASELKLPDYQGEGTSEPLATTQDCPVSLLFYHDLQEDSNGYEYPLATHDNLNLAGEEVNAYSLNWDGDAGRYEKFWSRLVSTLVDGEPLTKVARLSVSDLLRWRANPCQPVWCYQPDGAFTAIIQSISVKITLREQEELLCTLEMLKI